tara:strand:+ start:65 stop:523 length:459 start_codon:yes stop_codon:yes gene_type:complete
MSDVVRGFKSWTKESNEFSTAYPWADWFDGQQHRISQEDLSNMPFDDLARYAHAKARREGISVKTKRIERDRKTGKYKYLILEATCPLCKAIHSDLAISNKANKGESCFLNGFSPRYEDEDFVAQRKEYLARAITGFGYKLVVDHKERKENA